MMINNEKEEFVDDGHSIANMNVEGMPRRFNFLKKDQNRKAEYDVSKEEKRHLIFAAYKAFLPVLLCGIIGIALAVLLIMLWLGLF